MRFIGFIPQPQAVRLMYEKTRTKLNLANLIHRLGIIFRDLGLAARGKFELAVRNSAILPMIRVILDF